MMNRLGAQVAAVLVAGLVCAATAQADLINMGYETTSSDPGKNFTYDVAAGTLTSDSTVDLYIIADGTRYEFVDAVLDFDATVVGTFGGVFPVLDGTFSYTEDGTGDVIVSAAFEGAVMSIALPFLTTGSVAGDNTSTISLPRDLAFTAGAAFPVASLVIEPNDPQDFSFTLTGIAPVDVDVFEFDSSYSANAYPQVPIPEPASIALVGLAGICLIGRRKAA
jgi:hypothetical protein